MRYTTRQRIQSRSLLPIAPWLLPVALCVVIAAPVFAQGDEGVLLRLKYEAGETLTYHVTVNGVGSMQAAGQQQPLTIEGTFDNLMQVEQVSPEGNFTVFSTYDNLDLTVKMSGQDMDVPISLPDIRLLIMPTGKILSMELLEAEQPAQGAASLQAMVASSLDLESLLKDIKCVPFPEAAIKPGQEWEGAVPLAATAEGEEQRQMTMKLRYAANEEHLGRPCARLESTHEMPFGGVGAEAGLFDIKGTETGETVSWFDPELGRIIGDKGISTVEITMGLPAALTGGQQQMAIFVEMVVDSQTELVMAEEQ